MKPIKSYISLLLLTALSLGSCKKSFLEVDPKGKLIAKRTADYDLMLNNVYLLNTLSNAQMPMGDEVAACEPFFSGSALTTQRLFRWDDVVYEPNQDNAETLAIMPQIYAYNKIINEVMLSEKGTLEQKNTIVAEARASRAWCYFMLINYFGKPYQTATAATDPGVPLVTAADVTQSTFTRASVEEVYRFIIEDLNAAIPNLPEKITWRLRMSKPAAQAMLGKVYVFMQRFPEALPLLEAAIAGVPGSTIPVGLYDYNVTFAPGGAFLPIGLFGPAGPTAPNHQEVMYAKNTSNTWSFVANELVINPNTRSLYSANDLRLNLFTAVPYNGSPYQAANVMRRRGTPGSATPVGVYLPDVLLLQAECKARTGDLSGAKTLIESLRAKRMSGNVAIPSGMSSAELTRYIINEERVREFAVLGYRWFDMRRMSVDPLFNGTNHTHTLYNADGTLQATYVLRPERLVLRFGQKLMDANPNMINNP